LEPLTALLAGDVAVHGDGGGKAPVAGRPLVGPRTVARFLLGLWRRPPAGTRVSLAEVNGGPGLLIWVGETLTAVFAPEMSGGKIAGLYNVLNPDKLTYIDRQLRDTPYSDG
jgi:RNA polymerase sigma-70 factor, ECF subfamily